ncbi:MAG: RagB/SusD family nutrient uptake outer membrane protein [Chitinophagaceae bacterium]|nr:MAG: RagB/SusD family nutrient uptake outer membrane protein [Chitinophagaceae bacterium]
MKSFKYIFFIGMLAVLTGCQKYLVKAPLDSINTANYWQTPQDAINGINAAYQPLQWPKLYNLRMWTSDIFAGNAVVGAGGGTDGIETVEEANFITDPSNAGVMDLYTGPWPGILRCNLVLANVPGMNINSSLKERILGEAHFLRALYYFILVRYFGSVPLLTQPTSPKNLYPYRAPVDSIYHLIVSDLTDAIGMLPPCEDYSGADVGRASKGSATGLLAKVYLTMAGSATGTDQTNDYQQTVKLCQQVTALGYALNSNYAWNFDPAHKNGIESLFEVQYSGATTYGFFDNLNQASWTSTFMGPRNSGFVGGAYGWDQPTQEFFNSYEPNDKRKDITILYQGCPDFYGNAYKSSYSTTGYNMRKFLVPLSVSPDYNTSPEDFPVLRYADVLLMESEALNDLGQADAALDPINKVRARANLPAIQPGLSQTVFQDTVLHERRMELAFEGQRWFDLIRIDNGNYALQFFHSIGKTNFTRKFLLLPIPQVEIDANPHLTQNPGY